MRDVDSVAVRTGVARRAAQRAQDVEEEDAAALAKFQTQELLRSQFAAGKLTMPDFAKLARETGISAPEVAATLREAQARRAARIDLAAVARGDREAVSVSLSESLPVEGASVKVADCASVSATMGNDAGALVEAASAKAIGLDLLGRGSVAAAASSFARATRAVNSSTSPEACQLLMSSLLNEALCYLKLEQWRQAENACSKVLDVEPSMTKALFRCCQLHWSRVVRALDHVLDTISGGQKRVRNSAHSKRAWLITSELHRPCPKIGRSYWPRLASWHFNQAGPGRTVCCAAGRRRIACV